MCRQLDTEVENRNMDFALITIPILMLAILFVIYFSFTKNKTKIKQIQQLRPTKPIKQDKFDVTSLEKRVRRRMVGMND